MVTGAGGSWSHHNHSEEAERERESWMLVSRFSIRISLGWYRPQLGWVFPPQLTKPRSSLTDVPRGFSPGYFKILSSSHQRKGI